MFSKKRAFVSFTSNVVFLRINLRRIPLACIFNVIRFPTFNITISIILHRQPRKKPLVGSNPEPQPRLNRVGTFFFVFYFVQYVVINGTRNRELHVLVDPSLIRSWRSPSPPRTRSIYSTMVIRFPFVSLVVFFPPVYEFRFVFRSAFCTETRNPDLNRSRDVLRTCRRNVTIAYPERIGRISVVE